MTNNKTIDLGTAASLDRQTLIEATARLMITAAKDNSEVLREIIGMVDSDGELAAWSAAVSNYPEIS